MNRTTGPMMAHAAGDDRERCLEAGMDGYLVKPVNDRELVSLVESSASGDNSG